jgi:hypothetical protein
MDLEGASSDNEPHIKSVSVSNELSNDVRNNLSKDLKSA